MKKIIAFLFTFAVGSVSLYAAETAEVLSSVTAYKSLAAALGAAFAIAIAAFGGALGQGKAVQAALEGIGRNPGAADKLFVPMIVGLALIESLVIYALLISFMLLGKI